MFLALEMAREASGGRMKVFSLLYPEVLMQKGDVLDKGKLGREREKRAGTQSQLLVWFLS